MKFIPHLEGMMWQRIVDQWEEAQVIRVQGRGGSLRLWQDRGQRKLRAATFQAPVFHQGLEMEEETFPERGLVHPRLWTSRQSQKSDVQSAS